MAPFTKSLGVTFLQLRRFFGFVTRSAESVALTGDDPSPYLEIYESFENTAGICGARGRCGLRRVPAPSTRPRLDAQSPRPSFRAYAR
jgi:hypothetical protein